MKKYIFTLILGITTCCFGHAKLFKYGNYWYETIDEYTCETASGNASVIVENKPKYDGVHQMDPNNRDLRINLDFSNGNVSKNYDSVRNQDNLTIPEEVEDENGNKYTVVRIGDFSFTGGDGSFTKNLILPKTVKEIGNFAFFNRNDKIETITFEGEDENQLTTIGDYAFFKCQNLKELVIPNNVKTIGEGAFAYFSLNGSRKLVLGNSLETIGDYAFCWCQGLSSLYIPDSVKSLGNYAFYHCNALVEDNVYFGKNLQSIGEGCFTWGKFIIKLPASLTKIDNNAFNFQDGKDKIHDVYCSAVNPPTLDEEGFGYKDNNIHQSANGHWIYAYCCLHVPQGSRELYEADEAWSQFHCIIDDLIPEKTPTPENDENVQKIQDIIGYIFIPIEPNVDNSVQSYTLSKDVFPNAALNVDTWEIYKGKDKEKEVISLQEDVIKPLALGEQVIIGYNTEDNKISNGHEWESKKTIVGAVMVFVCPTITLVYGNLEKETDEVSRIKTLAVNSNSAYNEATGNYATYQHQSIYNSYPKFEIHPPQYIEFEIIEKAHVDEDGKYTNNYDGLVKVNKEEQMVGQGSETEGDYLVPLTSITENRIIKVSSKYQTYEDGMTVGVSDLQTSNFRIYAQGLTVFIEGANEDSVAEIFGINGSKILSTKEKSFSLPQAGVYLLNLEDTLVKVIVR